MKRSVLVLAAALVAGTAVLLLWPRPVDPPGHETAAKAVPAGAQVLAERRGALVDQVVFTREPDAGRAIGEIETGRYHLYAQGVSSRALYRRVRDSMRVDYELSHSSSAELTLNPVGPHFENGELNPFHVPEIREAMNWLIDRRHVAEEIYGGLASPRYLPLNTAFPDYARLAAPARALEQRYRHDPERAERVIAREMEALGAVREEGRWRYRGQPVRVSVLIRTDDARHRLGDYVANLLEDIGFQVERLYRTADEAGRIWIAGDPSAGRWHIYTGGWISIVINRDEADSFSYYYTPRGRPEPLWQAYRPAPAFDEITERLSRRDYATWSERMDLMAEALDLALRDSVRVWVVDQLNVWPRAAGLGMAMDLAGGVSGSRLWPYTIRLGEKVGGTVVAAVPSLLTEPWNPVAGSNWIFDQTIIRALQDPELVPDPFTGLYWPQRIRSAEVTVQEGAPVERTHDWLSLETRDEIMVPPETWIGWNAAKQRFVTVGEAHPEGITARTRTRVYYEDGYFERLWHDGARVSLADVVLPLILSFERADEASPLYDPAHVPVFETFRRHFRGWNIFSRDPLVIEVYSDQIHPDAETIVAARTPGASPWHTLAVGIRAELNGELAFSSHKADRNRIDWMNLVAGPSLPVLDRHLEAARRDGFVPFGDVLAGFMRAGETQARYQALGDWRAERRHFWVGSGPFYLHSVHPIEGSAVLRRFEDFPDASDKWLRFAEPEFPEVEIDSPLIVETADEGARFALRISFQDAPYPVEDIEAVRYLLFDGGGELAAEGEAEFTAPGRWTIALAPEHVAALGAGANSLEIAVTSRRVALPAFASHVFATIASRAAAGAGDGP